MTNNIYNPGQVDDNNGVTYTEELLRSLLSSNDIGYDETKDVYRDNPKTIMRGFSPIIYQVTIYALDAYYNAYTVKRLFNDEDNFKMCAVLQKKEQIKEFFIDMYKEDYKKNILTKDDVVTKIALTCYMEHLKTILIQGDVDSLAYHEIDRLENIALTWGIDNADEDGAKLVKDQYNLLKEKFEYRGDLNNLSLYTCIVLKYFMEIKFIRTIVDEMEAEAKK